MDLCTANSVISMVCLLPLEAVEISMADIHEMLFPTLVFHQSLSLGVAGRTGWCEIGPHVLPPQLANKLLKMACPLVWLSQA